MSKSKYNEAHNSGIFLRSPALWKWHLIVLLAGAVVIKLTATPGYGPYVSMLVVHHLLLVTTLYSRPPLREVFMWMTGAFLLFCVYMYMPWSLVWCAGHTVVIIGISLRIRT